MVSVFLLIGRSNRLTPSFTALSMFTGKLLKKYSDIMDPTPVLEFVANKLRMNQRVELIVLQEIITSMAGIVSEQNLNDAQLQALAGGEALRQQVLASLQDRRVEAQQSASRLINSLMKGELAGQLIVLIAQQRQYCLEGGAIEKGEDLPLKVIGSNYDEIHNVFVMFLELLNSGLSRKKFRQEVPDIRSLCLEYGLEPSIAWWISRATISEDMQQHDKSSVREIEEKKEGNSTREQVPEVADKDGDILMAAADATASVDNSDNVEDGEVKDEDINMEEGLVPPQSGDNTNQLSPYNIDVQSPGTVAPVTENKSEPWHPVLQQTMEKVQDFHPEAWSKFSLAFYVRFWQLSLFDIHVPMPSYSAERNKHAVTVKKINDFAEKRALRREEREERERCLNTMKRLELELKNHIRTHQLTRASLIKERDSWFNDNALRAPEIVNHFVQYCVWPRILLSPNDATFCAKYIRLLHSIGTPKFSTLGVYDVIFGKNLSTAIFMCTQREAENYGRFLAEVLTDLHAWHGDKKKYESEALGKDLTGFQANKSLLEWEDFRKMLYKWHKNMSNAFKLSFSNAGVGKTGAPGEYMRIRNAMIVLRCISLYFPKVDWIGKNLVEQVDALVNDKREDLKIAAQGLAGLLRKFSKGDKNIKGWMPTAEFQLKVCEMLVLNAREIFLLTFLEM